MELIRGLSFPEYQAIDALNWSLLKEMAKSPAHFLHRKQNPRPDSSRMAFGRAIHTAVLEPDRFPLEYVVFDGARRAGKAWDEFAEVNADKTILKLDEYEQCIAARDAVREHPVASDLLRGESEVTIVWEHPETGILLKGRIDHINEDCIVDLKSTSSVDERIFSQLSARMLYHAQLAFYASGLDLKENPRIIAVEADAPNDVGVFKVTDDLLYQGMQQVTTFLEHYVNCMETQCWPGRYGSEIDLDTPSWLSFDDEGMSNDWGALA